MQEFFVWWLNSAWKCVLNQLFWCITNIGFLDGIINNYARQNVHPKSLLCLFSPLLVLSTTSRTHNVITEKSADVHRFLHITKVKKYPTLFIFKSSNQLIFKLFPHPHIKDGEALNVVNPHIYFTTSNSFFNLISSDDCPIITINLPGSTVQFMFLSRIARSSGCRVKVTVFFSPGLRLIRSKPRRS